MHRRKSSTDNRLRFFLDAVQMLEFLDSFELMLTVYGQMRVSTYFHVTVVRVLLSVLKPLDASAIIVCF